MSYNYPNAAKHESWKAAPEKALRILDIGGGGGVNAVALKKHLNAEVCGVIDISEDAIANADPETDLAVCGNIEDPDILERAFETHGPFDLVMCLDVLEHLVDPWRVVARLHKLMPMDGVLVSSIPNVQNYRGIYRTITGTWNYRDSGLFDRTHLRYFGRASMMQLLTGTGLTAEETFFSYGGKPIPKKLDKWTLGVFSQVLALQYIVRVRKNTEAVIDPGFCGSNITGR